MLEYRTHTDARTRDCRVVFAYAALESAQAENRGKSAEKTEKHGRTDGHT